MKQINILFLLLTFSALGIGQTCLELPAIDGAPAGGVNPAGWSIWQSSPDIVAGNGAWPGGYGSYFVDDVDGTSTAGGQMGLFLANGGAGITGEGWQTTFTGLTIGVTYTISLQWQQATLTDYGAIEYAGGDLYININGVPTLFTSSGGVGDLWQTATVTFVATATTALFQICISEPVGGPVGLYGSAIVIDNLGCTTPVVEAGPNQTVCEGIQVTVSGSGATTYSWDNGVTNGVPFTQIPGTVTYTVTGYDVGGSSIGTDQLTITVNALPILNAGVDQTLCNDGTQVTLIASGATSYVWDNGVSNGVAFTSVLGSTTYTVTGTTNGCSITDAVNVIVNPLPTINAGLNQSICNDGTAVTLIGTGGTSYVWDNSVTNGVSFIPATGSTTYTVTGTDVNNCQNTDQVVIVNNAMPIVNAGLDQSICTGLSITLSGSGATSYSWDNGVTNGVSFTPGIGSTIYTITGTDINGCVDTDQLVVTVSSAPTISAGADLTICEGTPVTLSATSSGPILWDNGVTDGVAFNPPLGTTIYTSSTTLGVGCSATDQLQVTVNPIPLVNAGTDQTICDGTSAVLSASNPNAANLSWDNGVIDGLAFSPITSQTYTVTATLNGCTNSDNVILNVNPLPIAGFSADTLYGCDELFVSFANLSNPAGFDCVWDFGDGQTVNGCGNQQHFYTTSNVFSVSLTVSDANGCSDQFSIANYISVYPKPNASFSMSLNTISDEHEPVNFINSSVNADSYQWNFGDGSSSNVENPTHIFYGSPGSYFQPYLVATGAGGCTDSTSLTIIYLEQLIYYVPNTFTPNGDGVNTTFKPIFTSGFDYYDYHLVLFNRWGEIVFESYNSDYGWNGTYGNSGIVEDGVYIWKIDFKDINSDKRHLDNGHVTVLK